MRTKLTEQQDNRIDNLYSQLTFTHANKVAHALWNALRENELPESFFYNETGNITLILIEPAEDTARHLIVKL